MKTNRFFNFKRFYNLLSYDLQINYKRYILILTGIAIVMYLLLLSFIGNMRSVYSGENYTYVFSWCLMCIVAFAGNAFPELGNSPKTGNYLLLPASTLEKTASQFLIYIVFGFISFLLLYQVNTYLAKWTILQTDKQHITVIENFQYSRLFLPTSISFFWDKLLLVMSAVSIVTFFFAARLFFKRFAFIKSTITLFVILFLFVYSAVRFSLIFHPGIGGFLGFNLPIYQITPNLTNIKLFFYILIFPLWAFFLPLAYYKLKEKQG